MALAYIGLGSNLSDTVAGQELDSRAQLNLAIDSLSAHPHILVSKRSSFYQTPGR